ncbi:hypothetical protein [Azospirillum sp. sgz302134]
MPQLALSLGDGTPVDLPKRSPPPKLVYNTAVREQRRSSPHALDFLPTAPWAVRAFVEQYLADDLAGSVVLEPACGGGDMARTLCEYAPTVLTADIADYGLAGIDGRPVRIGDFLAWEPDREIDWVITNPPFKRAEAFIQHARRFARRGVAVLVRHAFSESIGRFERLFRDTRPDLEAVYVERVNMVLGRLDPEISTATAYTWMVWRTGGDGDTRKRWIAPARDRLERDSDWHGWWWRDHGGAPLPHLTLPCDRTGIAEGLARALPILRRPHGAVLHRSPHGAVASLLEDRDGRTRVLARITVRPRNAGARDGVELLVNALEDHRIPLIARPKRATPACTIQPFEIP